MKPVLVSIFFSIAATVQADATASYARVPFEWTYLLPHPFNSTYQYGWLNSTTTDNSTINDVLNAANQARIVSYTDEFDALVGPNPTYCTVDSPPGSPYAAYEGGAWIPATDEVKLDPESGT